MILPTAGHVIRRPQVREACVSVVEVTKSVEVIMAHNTNKSDTDDDTGDNEFVNFVITCNCLANAIFCLYLIFVLSIPISVALQITAATTFISFLVLVYLYRRIDAEDAGQILWVLTWKPKSWRRNWQIRAHNSYQSTPTVTATRQLRSAADWLQTQIGILREWASTKLTQYRSDNQSTDQLPTDNNE